MPRWIFITGLMFACVPSLSVSAASDVFNEAEGHVVLLDFWASWCVPCRRSFPWMNAMQRKYAGQGLKIIAVNLDSDRSSAEEFLREIPARFSLEFDPEGVLARKFDVQAMPSSFLLDESGNIVQKHLGFRLANAQHYEQEIKDALAAENARQASR